MKKYEDFGYNNHNDDISKVEWTKYKIVVPTKEDRQELLEAFEHIHGSDGIDTEYITVCQLAHEYEVKFPEENNNWKGNVIINKKLYEKLVKIYGNKNK